MSMHSMRPTRAVTRITDYHPDDAAAVADMFNNSEEGWPGGFMNGATATAAWVQRRQDDTQPLATFLAWDGQQVAGYCSLYAYPHEQGTAGYVGLLNVATPYQGHGYGRDLLRAALQHAQQLGYRHVDLGTWSGNLKAVPLYKKSGFFWEPDSDVHMENYLPLLLSTPALQGFFSQNDWYLTQIRDLSITEDLYIDGGMRVYPYEFRAGQRFVKATIDVAARGLTSLDTEDWQVICTIDDRHLFIGQPRTVRWTVINRRSSPLTVALNASATDGLHLSRTEMLTVVDTASIDAPLIASPTYHPPRFGQRPPRVLSTILLDGQPLTLETGIDVMPPIHIATDPLRVHLVPGLTTTIPLHITNNTQEFLTVDLAVAPSSGLTAALSTSTITLNPESVAGIDLSCTASRADTFTLSVQSTIHFPDTTVSLAPVVLPMAATTAGQWAVYQTATPLIDMNRPANADQEIRCESGSHRLVIQLRGGTFHLEDTRTGDCIANGLAMSGPPLDWLSRQSLRYTAQWQIQDGTCVITLSTRSDTLPDAQMEHRYAFFADGLLSIQSSILHQGHNPRAYQSMVRLWGDRAKTPIVVLPTAAHGIVASDDEEFPDWNTSDVLQRPDALREPWFAHQSAHNVRGIIWQDAVRITFDRWDVSGTTIGESALLGHGERWERPPVYIMAGPGSWRDVRAVWQRLICPNAPLNTVTTRPTITLTASANSDVLFTGENTCLMSSAFHRVETGTLTLTAPDGWTITPTRHDVTAVGFSAPWQCGVTVSRTPSAPRAASVSAVLTTQRAISTIWDGSVIDAGDRTGSVRINTDERSGIGVHIIDNGFFRLTLAPAFLGSAIALETLSDGINHLHSAFPQQRAFGWANPWYGGISAMLYRPGHDEFFRARPFDRENAQIEPVHQAGARNDLWHGLAVRYICQQVGLRGLEMETRYLTLPGSTLLAIQTTVVNRSTAALDVPSGIIAYVQPGGTTSGVHMLLDINRRRALKRFQRTHSIAVDCWAVADNPEAKVALALVCGSPHTQVVADDWGHLGGHLGVQFTPRVAAGSEETALAFLAIAGSAEEAIAYRALATLHQLP